MEAKWKRKVQLNLRMFKDLHIQELADWMEQIQAIFENTEPFREKEKWMEDPIQLN